jgi:hypothetical protein
VLVLDGVLDLAPSTLHDFGGVLRRPLDTLFWTLTIFMVTALGLCVKWPLCTPNLTYIVDFSKGVEAIAREWSAVSADFQLTYQKARSI